MKKRTRLLAGLMSAAVLMQGAAAMPSLRGAKPLTAEAVSVRSIQTRVFEFDFGSFRALYDNKTARWYTSEGKEIVSQTEPVQRVENPYFVEAPEYEYIRARAYIINMTDMTLAFEFRDGSVGMIDELDTAYAGAFRERLTEILALTPEYAPEYYDKAQQLYAEVPEPAGFPLDYVWRIVKAEDESDEKGARVYCDIYFGEHLYGSCLCSGSGIDFQKAKDIAGEGTADPFTDAGDASVDGKQDVADAVLTGKVAGEDEDTVISDLGMELADKDGDGLLTGSDATGILKDVAGITAPPDTPPEGAIPVHLIMNSHEPLDFFKSYDQSSESHADSVRESLIREMCFDGTWSEFYEMITSDTETIWYKVREAGDYDTVTLYYHPAGGTAMKLAEQALYLDADGILNVTAGMYCYSEPTREAAVLFTTILGVPHGVLPEIRGISITGTDPDRYGTDENAFFDDIPEELYLIMEAQQREAVPVIALEYPHENLEKIALTFGYQSSGALADEIMPMNINYQTFAHCTEGDTCDIWDFAYHINDEPGFHNAALRTLTISEQGELALDVVTYYDPDSEVQSTDWLEDPMQWIQIRVTVPHGALSDYVLRYNQWIFTERDAPFTASAFTQITPYTDGIRAEVQWDSEGQAEDAALVPEEIRTALGDNSTSYVFRQLRDVTDTDDADLQAILAEGKEILAIYTVRPQLENTLGVISAVTEGDTLSVEIADHCTEQMSAAFAYHRVLLITEEGTLPEINTLDVNVHNYHDLFGMSWYPEFLAATKNPVYLHASHITAAPTAIADGIRAEVISQNTWQDGFDNLIPEDVAAELKTPADTAFRRYFEPEDTDCEALQEILAQGKDVLAVYLLRSSGGSEFGVMRAERHRDTLNLMLAEHCDFESTMALAYHEILLITEDGALPEINTVNVDLAQVYQDTVRECILTDGSFTWATVDTLPDFEAAICNPVSIWEYADTCIPAHTEESVVQLTQEDSLAELCDPNGGVFVKLLRDPADTDDSYAQEILEGGTEDILLVYVHDSVYARDYGVTEVSMDESDTLHIGIASCTRYPVNETICDGHRILIRMEKDALPDFSDYTYTVTDYVTDYEIFNDADSYYNPDYLKAVRNPVYIDAAPQAPQIKLRGSQAGIGLFWRERDDLPADFAFEVEALDDEYQPDEDDWGIFISPKKILQDYFYWQNGTPDLTDGDLLFTAFIEDNWRGWVGVQSAALDGDGVLHLAVARCEGKGIYGKEWEEGNCTAAVIAMVGETGAFDGIRDVQLAYTDYDSYAEFASAIPQNLSILLQ